MPRFELHAPARIQVFPGGQTFDADVANVSERGLLMHAPDGDGLRVPENGTKIGIEVQTTESNHAVSLLAEVRWCADARFGVKIIAIAPPHSIRFMRIVDRARQRSLPPPA